MRWKDWKNEIITSTSSITKLICNEVTNVVECMMENKFRFNLQESVQGFSYSWYSSDLFNRRGRFSSDINCQTLQNNSTLRTFGNSPAGILSIALNRTLKHDIFFHDPNF